MVQGHLADPGFRIGVFYDKAAGWRAVAYSDTDVAAKQRQVDDIVRVLRERYALEE
jgi:hypothetical protein